MNSPKRNFQDVVDLMARLRAPGGCPWDREQDARSLRTYLLEETYEVLDAIEEDDAKSLREELGDLLLQVVFHAQIAREQGTFDIEDVLTRLHEKLVSRHPHVFGDTRAGTPGEVEHIWEAQKAAEKRDHGQGSETESHLSGVGRRQPALLEAYQLTRKASQAGFDWEKSEDVLAKLREEAGELESALAGGDDRRTEEEAGDLLFSAVNVARSLGLDPEAALRRANRKFRHRFQAIEEELRKEGKTLEAASLGEMDAIWNRNKSVK